MKQAKFVPLDRSDRKAAIESLNTAVRFFARGAFVRRFPGRHPQPRWSPRPIQEGRIPHDDRGGRSDCSRVARQDAAPAVCGEWAVRPGNVTVRFDPPVDTSKYDVDHRGVLLERVHAAVAENLPADQQPLSDFSAPADSAVD